MIRHVLGTVFVIAALVVAFVRTYGIGTEALLYFVNVKALAFVSAGWTALLVVNQGWKGTVAFFRTLTRRGAASNPGPMAAYSEKVAIALAVSAWMVAGTTYVVTYEDFSQIGAHLTFAWMSTLYAAVLYLISAAVVGRVQVVE